MSDSFDPRPPYSPLAPSPMVPPPTRNQQSWGALISIIVILIMVVVGALYAWGQRIAKYRAEQEAATSTTVTY